MILAACDADTPASSYEFSAFASAFREAMEEQRYSEEPLTVSRLASETRAKVHKNICGACRNNQQHGCSNYGLPEIIAADKTADIVLTPL